MSRRTRSALILLLSLGSAASLHAQDSAAPPDAPVNEEAPAGEPSFLDEAKAAAEQSASGDALGAAIAYERLLADPRLSTLSASHQSAVWVFAAQAAAQQKQTPLALQRMDKALAIDPHNGWARLLLAQHQLYNGQQDVGTANLIQGIADSDGAPDLAPEVVWQLVERLRTEPKQRLALLQGLFDKGWMIEGVEPMEAWAVLATLQADAGLHDAVAATLVRIDQPLTLVRLRADKRFDRYVSRKDPRFDPVASARRRIDRLRVDTMLSQNMLDAISAELTSALLVAGDADEVVGMTQSIADLAARFDGPPPEEGRWIAWMLNDRARALRRLGRNDEAVTAGMLSVQMADPKADPVSQKLNLAHMYVGLHRPGLARQLIKGLDNLSSYGEGVRDLAALRAALQLNDATAAQAARTALLAQRERNPRLYREALVIDNRLDDAAASLIQQLADPVDRSDALFALQDLRQAPPLPENVVLDARYRQLAARADVRAAVARVGHIDTYPLYEE